VGGGEEQNLVAGRGRISGREQEYRDWYDNLMDDVQFGSREPRLPLPYRAIPGPQFDPKDVPIVPAYPSGQLHFDPRYSPRDDLHYMAQGGGGINEQQLAAILSRLGYGGQV
jgi:hypothetical protein